jgi:hypothetical protein
LENAINHLKADVLVTGGGAAGICGIIESVAHGLILTLVDHPPTSARGPAFLQVSGGLKTKVSVVDACIWQPAESLKNNKVFWNRMHMVRNSPGSLARSPGRGPKIG